MSDNYSDNELDLKVISKKFKNAMLWEDNKWSFPQFIIFELI